MKIDHPKGIIKRDSETNLIEFKDSQLIDAIKLKTMRIETRTVGNLEGRSFYLSGFFDWIIVRDAWGELCLVPLKIEE